MNTPYKTMTRLSPASVEGSAAAKDLAHRSAAGPETEEISGQISGALLDFLKRKWFEGAHRKKFFAAITLVIIIAVGFGVSARYFRLTVAERAQKELATAIIGVSKLMILPEKDEPVLATVTDAKALIAQQAFFSGAVNGDQLLLFPKNMKAVIYSPSRNKIINAGPIEQQQAPEAAKSEILNPKSEISANDQNSNIQNKTAQSSPLKIAFYNGTKIAGLANEMESKLKAVFSDFDTAVKTNAAKDGYKETIVADLTGGTKSAEAQSIALALGAKVGALPMDETQPDADILVIAGE